MHNGQVGGFEQFRKSSDMEIPDALYNQRKGATDIEDIFLKELGYGLDDGTIGAMTSAVFEMEQMLRRLGTTPHMRFSAAFSDGKRLFAMRYASDAFAPSLYYKWCVVRSGYMVVSEPLVQKEEGWVELPAGSICEIADGCFTRHDITPLMAAA